MYRNSAFIYSEIRYHQLYGIILSRHELRMKYSKLYFLKFEIAAISTFYKINSNIRSKQILSQSIIIVNKSSEYIEKSHLQQGNNNKTPIEDQTKVSDHGDFLPLQFYFSRKNYKKIQINLKKY